MHALRWIPGRVLAVAAVALAPLLIELPGVGTDAAGAQPAGRKRATIVGSWSLNCESARGMVLDIVAKDHNSAVGRVKVLGKGHQFHYKLGDEILRLSTTGGSTWTGRLRWRNTAGVSRWQPITMKLDGDRLHGVTANEHCYENMERPR